MRVMCLGSKTASYGLGQCLRSKLPTYLELKPRVGADMVLEAEGRSDGLEGRGNLGSGSARGSSEIIEGTKSCEERRSPEWWLTWG